MFRELLRVDSYFWHLYFIVYDYNLSSHVKKTKKFNILLKSFFAVGVGLDLGYKVSYINADHIFFYECQLFSIFSKKKDFLFYV